MKLDEGFVYKVENNQQKNKVVGRIKRSKFYKKFHPNFISSKLFDTDDGVYQIDEFDYYDLSKIIFNELVLDFTLIDKLTEFCIREDRKYIINKILE